MILHNLSKKTILAAEPRRARSFLCRIRGMIGRKFIFFDALIFEHCNAIHTMFMSQKIDVLFVGRENKVLKAVQDLPPWKWYCGCKDARIVIELPPGTLRKSKTDAGDYINLDVECVGDIRTLCGKIIRREPETAASIYGDLK